MPSAEHEGITGVTFDSDGHRLLGTLYLARGGAPKPTVLLLHGCPGLQQNADLAVALRDRGWNSLVFHYRGCWGSGGDYDLRTIPRDVRAAVDHLQDGGYPGVDPARLNCHHRSSPSKASSSHPATGSRRSARCQAKEWLAPSTVT